MAEIPEARTIVLTKVRAFAPSFHEHIARSKLRGSICRLGDRVVVYEVICTEPDGPVLVSEKTLIQFRQVP
jgi:hypothetical protein